MNLVQQYIKETPAQLNKIIAGSSELFANVADLDIQRIILTGSGTSYHSGAQMQQLMRVKSGIQVESYYPFFITKEFLRGDNSHTLFVGISQGGSSFTTFDAMKLAKDAGCIVGTMAGEKDAYIDQLADLVMTVNIGEEHAGAKTKGFYATKLNLLLLAEYVGLGNGTITQVQLNEDMHAVEHVLDVFPNAYENAFNWVDSRKEQLAKADNIRVVGPAGLYGDVLESALKLLETCRLPVTGYDFDEFIHGVYNAIDEKSTVFFMDDGSEPRVYKILEVLSEWSDHLYIVSLNDANDDHHLGYNVQVPKELETFIFPLLFQVAASILPEVKGIDPSKPKDPQFHMKLGSKKFNH